MKALLTLALLPVCAIAASPFDGIWKTRADSIKVSGKPHDFELNQGVFSCNSCTPSYKIVADGSDQVIAGHEYLDHEAVKVVSPSSVERTYKKDGKVTNWEALSVSNDGRKLTVHFKSYAGKEPSTGVRTETRVAAGAPGSHAISGQWQPDSPVDMQRASRTVLLSSTSNGLKMAWSGYTVEAPFDGKPHELAGDPGRTTVSLRMIDRSTLEETDTRQGQVMNIVVWALAADGKSIEVSDADVQHGTKTVSVLDKQP